MDQIEKDHAELFLNFLSKRPDYPKYMIILQIVMFAAMYREDDELQSKCKEMGAEEDGLMNEALIPQFFPTIAKEMKEISLLAGDDDSDDESQ